MRPAYWNVGGVSVNFYFRQQSDALSVAVSATVCLAVTAAKNNTAKAQKDAFDTVESVMERVTKADCQGLVLP